MFSRLFQSLELSSFAAAIRQSSWMYPALEIIHIFGIVLVAGGAILFDLAIITRKGSFSNTVAYDLTRWSRRGLWLVIPSGFLLFMTNAIALGADPVMASKMILLLLAGINAYIFYVRVTLPGTTSAGATPNTFRGRTHAIISIVLWMSIIICGRLLAY